MFKSHVKSHLMYTSLRVNMDVWCSTANLAEWKIVIRPCIRTGIEAYAVTLKK